MSRKKPKSYYLSLAFLALGLFSLVCIPLSCGYLVDVGVFYPGDGLGSLGFWVSVGLTALGVASSFGLVSLVAGVVASAQFLSVWIWCTPLYFYFLCVLGFFVQAGFRELGRHGYGDMGLAAVSLLGVWLYCWWAAKVSLLRRTAIGPALLRGVAGLRRFACWCHSIVREGLREVAWRPELRAFGFATSGLLCLYLLTVAIIALLADLIRHDQVLLYLIPDGAVATTTVLLLVIVPLLSSLFVARHWDCNARRASSLAIVTAFLVAKPWLRFRWTRPGELAVVACITAVSISAAVFGASLGETKRRKAARDGSAGSRDEGRRV